MEDCNVFSIKTWTGDEKKVKKITLYPEIDEKGEIFFKIEGQINTEYFMINYNYDKELAIKEFYKLLDEFIQFHIDAASMNY